MEKSRAWEGWPLFSYGFRPFFLFGALHAATMMAVWVLWLQGALELPSAFDPVTWHIHELLFGYVPAIMAGFLLTAVPNWTGRLPVVGWPLVGLFALWLAGRISIAFSQVIPVPLVLASALAFSVALVILFGQEVIAGRNWRNLKIVAVLSAFVCAQSLFYYEIMAFDVPIYAQRAAIALVILLIQIIGGRVVPSFTHNWLKRQGVASLPKSFGSFDRLVMVANAIGLAFWILLPLWAFLSFGTGVFLLGVTGLNIARQARWHPLSTWREPLVAMLHLAFFSISAGFFLAGYAALLDAPNTATAAIHCWTVGSIGGMTLAMATRASRGYTGQTLTSPISTSAIYALIVLAAISRIAAGLVPELSSSLVQVAGLAWFLSFAGFVVFYGPLLMRKRSRE